MGLFHVWLRWQVEDLACMCLCLSSCSRVRASFKECRALPCLLHPASPPRKLGTPNFAAQARLKTPKSAEKCRKTPKSARLIPPKKRSTAIQNGPDHQESPARARTYRPPTQMWVHVGTGVFLWRGASSGLFVVVLCFGQDSA